MISKKSFIILSLIITLSLINPYISVVEKNINSSIDNSMMISFFIEYPDKELDSLKLVDFPTKLYIAASSLEEFNEIKSKIRNKHVKETIYWPVLEDSEGYWLSPFAERRALLKVINETGSMQVIWDSELPKKKFQIITRIFNFFRNKAEIIDYFNNHGDQIYTAEYFPHSRLLELFGLSFNPNIFGNKQIKMVYSSMHDYSENVVRKEIAYGKKHYGDNFLVAFGTLATGVKGDEPQIKPEVLDRDLRIAKKYGLKEVIIYRLGGLDKEYLDVIKKYNQVS